MSIKMDPASVMKIKLGLGVDGEVHKFFTNTCALYMDRYVPFDEGILAGTVVNNGQVTANVTTDTITYETPYASYQYYGMRKDGSHKINEANRNRTKHPLATSYWDKHMVTAHIKEIEKAVQDFINRGGKQ